MPLLTIAALVWITSVVVLYKKLPIWSVVDGITSSSQRRVDAGTASDSVTAATDVATRALDMSLRTLNDRGELQSCSYWHQMVPNGRHSGMVVAVSGGLHDKLGSEVRVFRLYVCLGFLNWLWWLAVVAPSGPRFLF